MTIYIGSEEEAWAVLDSLLSGETTVESIDEIAFGDWLKTTVYIPEQRYDSALNAYMMQGWVETQRAIYRSYAIVAKGAPDARALSDAEREALELVVTVESGSSDQEAELMEILKEVLTGAVDKMDPTTLAIVIVALALIWAGQSVMRSWISSRKEERLAETNNKSILKALETIQVAVSGDSEKQRLLERAADEQPVLNDLRKEADSARQTLVRHTSQTDARVNGVELPSDVASTLTTQSRASSEEERKDGTYWIRKVDTTVPDGFRVYVENVQTDEAFQANVQEVMSSRTDRELIQEAEWTKAPVELQINARVKRGQVIEAVILRASRFERPQDVEAEEETPEDR